ncbi:MAG: recombination protein RecR [Chlamydiae bacterium RIFCSPHIGHO2_12_FULL_44_59]|nr:MAG: recombination protein RecR [Chlamydiae bacterium RIFCSPHIGHO2_01_FULL_44_39]OGN60773.1 MAG: recombination protein RecR [Chlamydiae bacterium RIFCSPHIGHO2_12_FULL_44_59]OGN67033.1 MAG: recombination protein RecR [Chlamydiae bacterium RIFCSPLOWO2_01_FULL_44_52]OGN67586.1 MAG: recombination protein RecR [Chlamydiae bacterium RIFCSPLOWO2_02_FULL_45_22]OGN71287.1 MAG: recombination protein RecR [Chlamydiae bacterium RIFCSPLOWO2_12_FULL_45_20]
MAHKFPSDLLALITHFKKFPGVGTKTATRFAFELISWDKEALRSLSALLMQFHNQIVPCTTCGCLTDCGNCSFCKERDEHCLCILASPRETYAIEETGYRGLYHIIEHLLSPIDGRHAEKLRIDRIQKRIDEHSIQEVILAFDSTLEGDTTALYLKSQLKNVVISRLAFGLPVGSSLEYIDGSTLARALLGRQTLY